MNALPNPDTNGIAGLLQGNSGPTNVPQAGTSGPNPTAQPGKPDQQKQQQQAPLDPKLIQAFEDMKLRAAAQRQQALQTPQQPPVVEQLAQQAQQLRQQQMDQQVPQPDGQQIPQAPQGAMPGMAGGGIVALAGGGFAFGLDIPFDSEPAADPNADDRPQRPSLAGTGPQTPYYGGTQLSDDGVAALIQQAKAGDQESLRALAAYVSKYPSHVMRISKLLQSGQINTVPRRGIEAALPQPKPPQPQPQQEPQAPQPKQEAAPAEGLDALLEKNITEGLQQPKPDVMQDKQADWYQQRLGMEPLLKAHEERVKGIEALNAQRRKPGIEDWLMGMAKTAPTNDSGSSLGAAGAAYLKAKDADVDHNVAFATKMAELRDAAMKAQLEGNKGSAEAGVKARGDTVRSMSDFLQQGVGLSTKRAADATRRHEGEQTRLARAHEGELARANRLAARSADDSASARAALSSLAAEIKELQASKTTAANMQEVEKEIAAKRREMDAIRKRLVESSMPGLKLTDPGASSPAAPAAPAGGNVRLKFDAKGNPI